MTSSLTKLCVLVFSITCSVSASDFLKQVELVAEQAVAARQKVMQQDATAADVDAFLVFGTDNLTYEDPVVKMKVEGRDRIRQGMVNFLGLSRRAHIAINKRIAVANVVVLDQEVSFEEKQQDNSWKPRSRHQVTIFEFEGAKIRRIADYWSR
jgi:hypothetical protein